MGFVAGEVLPVATHLLQCVALCCRALQCVAVCCSVRVSRVETHLLQFAAVCCSVVHIEFTNVQQTR